LRLPPAKTSGDAFDIDQIDRDHSRNGFVPPAMADGYRIDSNGNSAEPLSHAKIGSDCQGAKRQSFYRRALKPGSRFVQGPSNGWLQKSSLTHSLLDISIAVRSVEPIAQQGEQREYSTERRQT